MTNNTKTLTIGFNQGTSSPPKLGTPIIKPTGEGQLSYSQNVTTSNDKYGDGVVTPGPYINFFVSGLANPVYLKAKNTQTAVPNPAMWINYNGTVTLDYISGIGAGGTPVFNNSNTVTITTTAAGVVDIESAQYQGSSSIYTYVVFTLNATYNTPTSAYIAGFQTSANVTVNIPLTACLSGQPLPMIKTQFDGNIYIGNGQSIDRVIPAINPFSSGVTKGAVGTAGTAIPYPWVFTAMGEWNGFLVGACNNESPGDFTKRNGGGQSRVFFWDIANSPTGNFKTNFVNSPAHYISVLFTDLSGNLLAFGGVDEGRSTIYQYNGYGFIPLFSYIGDLPRNRHSVCYDAQGRLVWTTANGQVCRLNTTQLLATSEEEAPGVFEHIGTIGVTGQGGICTNLQSTGDDFAVSGGGLLSQMSFTSGQFTGDSNAQPDTVQTPLAISGLQSLPPKSIIMNTIIYLNKALQPGEIIEARLYPFDYDTSGNYTLLGTLNYAIDGSVGSKNVRSIQYYQDNMALGVAWKGGNGSSTAPGVLKADVQYKQITTL